MAIINGTPANETLNGTNADDTIFGQEGADTLQGNDGNDRLELGIGTRDTTQFAYGGNGNDTIFGGESTDNLYGGANNDILYGGGGNDYMEGGLGNDTTYGGSGDDEFFDNDGADTLYGGAGEDLFRYVSYNTGVSIFSGGTGVDTFYVYADVSRGASFATWGVDTITDFAAGNNGDILNLGDVVDDLVGWNSTINPFLAGYLRFLATDLDGDGAADDLAFQIDRDGLSGGGGYMTFVNLLNVSAGALTVQNFTTAGGGRPAWSPTGTGVTYVAPQERDRVNQAVDGSDDVDSLTGSVETETIQSYGGEDTLSGEGGNDTLYGGTGNDTYYGGAGNDTVFEDNGTNGGNDTIYGGTGNDNIYSQSGNDTVYGGDGADNFYDATGDDAYYGGAGDDNFTVTYSGAAQAADRYTGGTGRDSYDVSIYYTAVLGGSTPIILDFDGRSGGDSVRLLGSTSYLTGLGDRNPFEAGYLRLLALDADADGSNDDVMLQVDVDGAGNGPWANIIAFANTTVSAFENGAFMLDSDNQSFGPTGVGRANVIEGYGNRSLVGTRDDDTLTGSEGTDSFQGYRGDDVLSGGVGNDSLQGNEGNDTLDGGTGNDTLYDQAGNDMVYGGEGDDTFYVYDGNDQIFGGAGDDTVHLANASAALVNSKTIDTGAGDDLINTVSYDRSTETITLGAGRDGVRVYARVFDDAAVVADLLTDFVGGIGGDYVLLDSLYSYFQGYVAGSDPFVGGYLRLQAADVDGDGADDTVLQVDRNGGGNPAEFVTVLRFANILPAGFDAYNFYHSSYGYVSPDPLNPTPGAVATSIGYGPQNYTGTSLDDNLSGGESNDNFTGQRGDDILAGNGGIDSLQGNDGDDQLFGGDGADTLYDQDGNDSVFGGAGNDTLYSYNGSDSLNGDDGDDSVYLEYTTQTDTGVDTVALGAGDDLVSGVSYNRGGDAITLGAGRDQVTLSSQRVTDATAVADTITDFTGGRDGDFVQLNNIISSLTGYSASALNNPFALGFLRLLATDIDADGVDDVVLQVDRNGGATEAEFVTVLRFANTVVSAFESANFLHTTYGNSWDPTPAVNDAPVAEGAFLSVVSGASATTNTNLGLKHDAYDPDGRPLTAAIVTPPAVGVLAVNADNNNFSFNAAGVAAGTYTFTYSLSDGTNTINKTGTIIVLANNSSAFDVPSSRANDNLGGNEGANVVSGGIGNDSLSGNGGADTLNGDVGDDNLYGGSGIDTLNGGVDNDYLDGGTDGDTLYGGTGDDQFSDSAGNNTIYGGDGADTFVNLGYQNGTDTVTGGAGRDWFDLELYYRLNTPASHSVDTITDFVAGPGGDIIYMESYSSVFTDFDPQSENAFTTGHLILAQVGGDTVLRGDLNGDGADIIDLLILQGVTAANLTIDNFRAAGMPNLTAPNPTGLGQTLTGTILADNFDGSNDADTIYGDPGSGGDGDNLRGQGGDDAIYGGDGNDTLQGDGGTDTLYGGDDNDALYGGASNDATYGGEGNDAHHNDAGDDTHYGDAGNDTFHDYTGNNVSYGGAGEDIFNNLGFGAGSDTVTGGTGRDTFNVELYYRFNTPATNVVDTVTDFVAGPGGDILFLQNYTTVFSGISLDRENPFATGHLILAQVGAHTVLRGDVNGDGVDIVDLVILQNVTAANLTIDNFRASGPPNQVGPSPTGTGIAITGTAYGDDFDGSNDADIIFGDPDATGVLGGDDSIRAYWGDDVVDGRGGNDSLYGGEGEDDLSGGQGNDALYGEGENDTLTGGEENDSLYGGAGQDTLFGGDGDDYLEGSEEGDLIYGGTGDDTLYDYRGNDVMYGGDGDDYFQYATYYSNGSPTRTLTGGAGSDLYSVYGYGLRYNGETPDTTITDFAVGAGGDVIRFEDMSNLFTGWDTTTNPFTAGFLGLTAVDADADGSADDTEVWFDINGATGGQQRLVLATLLNVAPASLTAANFSTDQYGAGAFWEPSGATRIINGSDRPENNQWNPTLIGSLASDVIYGGAGDETIDAYRGDDQIYGGSGGDNITGNVGNDQMYGDEGYDSLTGGDGNDAMYGGEGNDNLYGGNGDDTQQGGAGDDYLYDTDGINTLDGGDGADLLGSLSSRSGGGAVNTVTGGSDRDTFDVQPYAFYYTSQGAVGANPDIITDFEAGAGGDILDMRSWSESFFTGWDDATNPFTGGRIRFLVADADSDGAADDILVQGDRDAAGATHSFTTGVILLNVDPADIVRSQVLFAGNRTWSQSGADGLPESLNESYAVNEDGTLSVAAAGVLANDTDPQGDPLTAVLETGPSHGTLTLNANGSFTYTPNTNFTGADSFTYRADDGTSPGNLATVSITVDPLNDAAIANPNAYVVMQGTTLVVVDGPTDVLANDVDPDGDAITAVLETGPANGTLTLNANGSFNYTPNAAFFGVDSFTYRANDGTVNSAPTTVTITVQSANVAPVAVANNYAGTEDTTLTVNAAAGVLANDTDADGDPMTAELVSGPFTGSLTLNADGSFNYVPSANFNGPVTFSYRAYDGEAYGNTVNVTLNIAAVNDAPVADADGPYAATEDTLLSVSAALGVLSGDSDVDGDTLTAVLVADAANGTVTLNANGSFDYTPDANFTGVDSFQYQATDPSGALSNIRTIQINVAATNDAPVGVADAYNVAEDAVLTVPVATGLLLNDSDPDGDPITAVLVTGTGNGSLSLNANGSFVYAPNANFAGTDSFVYRVNDGAANSANVVVNITVTGSNDAPNAVNDSVSGNEDSVINGAVLGNDTDVDGDGLTVALLAGPASGSVVLNANGTFVYTPNANFSGGDSFTYTLSDGNGGTDTATVSISVNPINDAPVAVDDGGLSTAFQTALDIASAALIANDFDADGNPLTVTSVSGAVNGTAVLAGGLITFTPTAGYSGPASFTYTISDGAGGTDTGLVNLTVGEPGNTPPNGVSDAFSGNEDTVINGNVLANDTDADADALTAALVTGPANGTLTFNADGSFAYTPNANFNGTDSFTYAVDDGTATAGPVTVTLTVNAVNDAPIAGDDAASGNEDTVISGAVLGNDTDIDGAALSATVLTGPANGTLALNGNGTFNYTPNANFNGSDSFSYTVSDGAGGTDTATVSITVNPVNDVPVSAADSYAATEDQTLVVNAAAGVLANDSDVDGDALSVLLIDGPANGTLTLNPNGSFSYTPDADFNGTDSFTYGAQDPTMVGLATFTGPITVTINVGSVNDAPVAVDDVGLAAGFETALNIPVATLLGNDTDADGDGLSVTAVSGAVNGTASLAGGVVTFTPAAGYSGPASFSYTISDGNGGSDTGTVNLTVGLPGNTPPVGVADAVSSFEDTNILGNVLANDTDADGDALTAALATGPANGTLTFNADGSFSYAPNANFNGGDSFTYTVDDGTVSSGPVTVTITVNLVNDAPVAGDDAASGDEDTVINGSVLGNDSDIDSAALTTSVLTGPANGTLTLNANGTFSYTPNANFNGSDSFTYTVSDGAGGTDTATVSLTVNSVNDGPDAVNDGVFTTPFETSLFLSDAALLGNDTDVEGNALSVVSVQSAVNGTVSLLAGEITFTPTAGYSGAASFSYTVSDSNGGTDTATVSLTVGEAGNTPPAGAADSYAATEDNSLIVAAAAGVLANDSDADGDPIQAAVATGPANGTLVLNADGSFSYTPNANFNGADSFTYTLSDGAATAGPVTVTINVAAINDAPLAGDDAASGDEDTIINGAVLGNDSDIDGLALTAAVLAGPVNGTLVLNGDGTFAYTPNANFNGNDSFTYTVSDGAGGSDTATVSITVNPVNDAPVAADDAASGNEDTVINGSVLGNDTDIDGLALTAAVLTGPANGTLVLNGNGTFAYTPNANFNGNDSFTYTVSDGAGGTDTATVSLTVNPVNDNPDARNDGTYSVGYETPTNITAAALLANDLDADGNALSITSVQSATNGTVSLAGGLVTFTPTAGYSGAASFTYTISDGNGGSDTATVALNVGAPSGGGGTPGDDLFYSTPANENFDGGAGNDTVSFQLLGAGVTARLGSSVAQNTGAGGIDSYTSIENLRGSRYNDNLYGNNGDNLIAGDSGDDFISGLGGNDILQGNAGTDKIDGGAGNDKMSGGFGVDTISYLTNTLGVTVNLMLTGWQNTGTAGLDEIRQFENLEGSRGNDMLTGDDLDNVITGASGDDTINGRAGNDTLRGDQGNDVLNGGAGIDSLGGGAGADTFVFTSLDGDTVLDFTIDDVVNVSAFAGAAFSIATVGNTHTVSWDTDADGAFDDGAFIIKGTGFDATKLDFVPL